MANPRRVTLGINARTGMLSGRFTLEQDNPVVGGRPARVKRIVPYQALLVRWGDGVNGFLTQGTGYCLVPQLPGGPTLQLSGLVTFDALPQP